MISVQNFATREAEIARVLGRDVRIGTACAKEGLSEAVRKQCFADVLRPIKEVGMTYSLRGESAAQNVDCMFVANDIPIVRGELIFVQLHTVMVAETEVEGKEFLVFQPFEQSIYIAMSAFYVLY